MSLRQAALAALLEPDPVLKAERTQALHAQVQAAFPDWAHTRAELAPPDPMGMNEEALARMGLDAEARDAALSVDEAQAARMPGRPERPTLVSPTEVPTRSPFTPEGRAALLHAICHIEFNAINLALDALWRFEGMPARYYLDWLRVASEEALHFSLLRQHLLDLGHDYGDFEAHNGLWAMCERTQHDIVARMALVPRTLEARGLDATPQIQAKLTRAGDLRAVAILDTIVRDEVGHVAIGNRWFRQLCAERGLDPVALYPDLVKRFDAPRIRPPFNEAARLAAGFTPEEMAFLLGLDD